MQLITLLKEKVLLQSKILNLKIKYSEKVPQMKIIIILLQN